MILYSTSVVKLIGNVAKVKSTESDVATLDLRYCDDTHYLSKSQHDTLDAATPTQ